MKLLLTVLLVVALATVHCRIPPLPPYPAPALWAKDPLYFKAINSGNFSAELTADVSFNPNPPIDFGIQEPTRSEFLYGNVLQLKLIREGCPGVFNALLRRKINQLRQRHQAPPLNVSFPLYQKAQQTLVNAVKITKNGKTIVNLPHTGPGASLYIQKQNTSSLEYFFLHPEYVVKQFYLNGVKNYRKYGKHPSFALTNPRRVPEFRDFFNLIYANSTHYGYGCLTVQEGSGMPVSNITNQVLVYVIYNNQEHVNYKDNIFPPGYFSWDKGLNVSSNSSENIKLDRSLNDQV